jgi:hypothetical protein
VSNGSGYAVTDVKEKIMEKEMTAIGSAKESKCLSWSSAK